MQLSKNVLRKTIIESLIFGALMILNGDFFCLSTLIFKQNAK